MTQNQRRKPAATRMRPKKSDQVPATKKFVDKVRAELLKKDTSIIIEMRAGFKSVDKKFTATDAKIEGLRSDMKAGFKEVDSRFDKIDSKFKRVDSKFKRIDARFLQIDARFHQVDARFHQVDSRFNKLEEKLNDMESRILLAIGKLTATVEAQNAQNLRTLAIVEENTMLAKFALDGYAAVDHRIDLLEKKFKDV